MDQLQSHLNQVRDIKNRYEQEIHQFIQQKLNAFHTEVNLPIQYIDIDIENTIDDGRHQSNVENFRLHIQVDL